MSRAGAEPAGYGLYTYVIFGKARPAAPKDDVVRRERALLIAIESLGPNPPDRFPSNLFCIPVKGTPPDAKPGVDNYNSQLSDTYRYTIGAGVKGGHLAKLAVLKLIDNQGPFLISSQLPLRANPASNQLLIVDFSTVDPDGIKQAIEAYRQNAMPQAAGQEHSPPLKEFLDKLAKHLKNLHAFAEIIAPS